ncbi:MAG: hypothetical protein Q8R20_01810 [Nanoarchaeota archaeon]|nr:hypothetical protein [Nanoarchaeota archaeon]
MILFILTLSLLLAAFFLQIRFPERLSFFRGLFFASFFAILFFYLVLVYLQYAIWKESGPPASLLIPPHQNALYVFSYHFVRFGVWYALSFVVALLTFFSMRFLNKKFEERFFEPEEAYLGAIAVFLLGNPSWHYAWVYYFLALGFASLLGTLFFRYILHLDRRFSFYWLWIPVALGVIMIMSIVL